MDVIPLDAHLNNPEIFALCGDDRGLAYGQIHVLATQPRGAANDTHRDVHRVTQVVLGPGSATRSRARSLRLAPGAWPSAAMRPEHQLDLPVLHSILRHTSLPQYADSGTPIAIT